MNHEIECNITGRVQMVMFRDFAKRKADKLCLTGFAKNLKNNSLKVVAQGEKPVLDNYINLLKKGPILARVDDIDIIWREPQKSINGFQIMYD